MGVFQSVGDKIAAGADWVEKTGEAAIDTTGKAGKEVYSATKDAAAYGYEKGKEAAVWTKDKAVTGATWARDKAVASYEKTKEAAVWTKDQAVAGYDWTANKADELNKKGKKKVNDVVGNVAEAAGKAATRNKTVEKCIEKAAGGAIMATTIWGRITNLGIDPQKEAKEKDGQYMGNDCPNSSASPPAQGRLPKGCPAGANLPTVIYTNGINTDPKAACATMHNIADTRCVQVIGVYNASFGMMTDLLDCKNNIDKAGTEPSAHSQARLIQEKLSKNPPERVTIYAHSQGGLITQEGINEANTKMKRELALKLKKQGMSQQEAEKESRLRVREQMSNLDVHSFGTAEAGWPSVGANYHQMTNTADPVPRVIRAVQHNRGTDIEPDGLKERHRFEQNEWNPIGPHSMDDAYLRELNTIHPVPKKAGGGCC